MILTGVGAKGENTTTSNGGVRATSPGTTATHPSTNNNNTILLAN